MKIHVESPDAIPIDVAIEKAFASYGCTTLGGASLDGWSKMIDLQRCAYRYYLRHERELMLDPSFLTRASNGALEVGGLTHAATALHYSRMLPKGYPGWQPNLPGPMEFLDRVVESGGDRIYVSEARRLYGGYAEHYGYEQNIQPVAIEYAAGQPGIHTCRYDMLAHWDGGGGVAPPGLWNFELKTAARETSDVLEGWWLDGEILGQQFVFEKFGLEKVFGAKLQGTVINLIFKSHPPVMRRLEIVLPRPVVESFVRDRAYWSQYRDHCRAIGQWPRSLQGCVGRYDMCEFWSHCRDENQTYLIPLTKKKQEGLL